MQLAGLPLFALFASSSPMRKLKSGGLQTKSQPDDPPKIFAFSPYIKVYAGFGSSLDLAGLGLTPAGSGGGGRLGGALTLTGAAGAEPSGGGCGIASSTRSCDGEVGVLGDVRSPVMSLSSGISMTSNLTFLVRFERASDLDRGCFRGRDLASEIRVDLKLSDSSDDSVSFLALASFSSSA